MRYLKPLSVAVSLLSCTACGGGGGGGTPSPADTTAPSVSITAPAGGTVSGSSVTVSAAASDNIAVSKVEFYLNGALLGTDTTAPYTYDWNTQTLTRGNYTLTARAYDAANNTQQSAGVAVTVPISASMSTSVSGSTATGTVSVHGLPAVDAYGIDFQLAMPVGATVSAVQGSGPFGSSGVTFDRGGGLITYVNTNMGSGEVMTVDFANVPAGTTGGNFGIGISAVFDGGGVQIQ